MELKQHQQEALKELKDGKILWGPTGSGKSRVAVAYYELEHRHRPVFVITTAKKRDSLDWQKEFARIGVGKNSNATVHSLLTVDSFSNLHKYTEVSDCFFIFDEQRLTGSGQWAKSFLKIAKNNKWIMLTATPGDSWLDYIPVFVANGFYPNRTAFKREHVIYSPFTKFPKVDRYVSTSKLEKHRKELLIRVVWSNFTIRHTKTEFVDHNEELLQHVVKNRWHIYQNRPIRDVAELFGVMRKVVNNDPSRVRRILELYGKHPKMIVFYNFDYELEALKKLESDIEIAEWNGHKHEPIPTGNDWLYLVQYVAGSESWNCVETDTTTFYSLTYSYKNWHQAHGRIDRMNTPFQDLYYNILRSKSFIDSAIWRSLQAKHNFQPLEFDLTKIMLNIKEK